MYKAYLITDPAEYKGAKLNEATYFNPFQDDQGRWLLSIEEVEQAEITGLELVDFELPPQDFDLI